MNIVITGASSGIGFATALALCKKDKNQVFGIARNSEKLRLLKAKCESLGTGSFVVPIKFDLCKSEDNFKQLLLPKIARHCTKIDILINNAGILVNKPFHQLTAKDWELTFETNLFAAAKMVKILLPLLGGKTSKSHVLNIGSMGGFQGSQKFTGLSAYSASKAALVGLTETLAEELKDRNIAVNCLCPGAVQTEMSKLAFPELNTQLKLDDVAEFIANFAVQGHKLFNGKVLPMATGMP